MSVPIIKTALTTGEVSPSLFGHVDLARMASAASTMRNLFVGIRGGGYSRAGSKFVGFSKQTGRAYPPRLIPFQFSINQGLTLEFGNDYMRVISNGAFVTEEPFAITGATQANPCVLTVPALGAATATANVGAVTQSYVQGDTITLAGGSYITPAIVAVTDTQLATVSLDSLGTGVYAPGDTVNLAGGTQTTAPVITIDSTQVVSATLANAGAGGSPGVHLVSGTTGVGTVFIASVTIGFGGNISSINSITEAGTYTTNPTNPANEPVNGSGLVGAAFNVQLGIRAFHITNRGAFTVNAPGGLLTQASTSGSGTGATFNNAIFGPKTLTISDPGIYTSFPANPVSQASTSGVGIGSTFTLTTTAVSPFANGDWVFIADVGGMTELNGETYVVAGVAGSTFQLKDVYGNNIDATGFGAYTAGGTAARIYTLTTTYSEVDLKYLKFTQSADVMSLCCVNQQTGTEYPPLDLSRLADDSWTLTSPIIGPTVTPPPAAALAASTGTGASYAYVVTSVSPDDGTESIASSIATLSNGVNLTTTPGTVTFTWTPVSGVNEYNIYKAQPVVGTDPPPAGALFGYAGSAFGSQFIDTSGGIIPDFSQVPPTHRNPFARGQIIGGKVLSGGTTYTSVGFTISTSTGSGASLSGVLVSGALVAILVEEAGENYAATDTVIVTGDGTGATAALTIGAQTGTYPSVVTYFQQRRDYANTLNNPDTYFLSQPGSYTNFDIRIPTIDSDAITGTPWAVEVNGIQFMVPMPGGLMVLTGLSGWLLNGSGGSALNPQPIAPSSQNAQPQASNGCSATVPPFKIDYDVIFLQAKGSVYRRFNFNLSANIYTGEDITINSAHLFVGYTIKEHAWCEEPFKTLWAVRSDGALLSATIEKPQEVLGWARHDTQGLYQSVCAVTEPPVDALYQAVQRFPGTHTAYMIERADDRLWADVEDCWCVDCGLSLAQPTPAATLTASSATGLGSITGVTALVGGTGYSAGTTAVVVDDDGNGPGTGALAALTIAAGVITAVSFAGHNGSGYVNPKLVITDPAGSDGGSGASAHLTLNNAATFTADAAVFASGDVGKVIRMGGGIATITVFTNTTHVTANITSPIVQLIPNSGGTVMPQPSGSWTMTTPVSTISGLRYLAGATVTGLADGNVITARVVSASGTITLDTAASAVTIGLGFQAQLQSVYLEAGTPTMQGQRKKIGAATARIQTSRGLKIGCNQPDGSTQSPVRLAPTWAGLADVPDDGPNFPFKPYNATATPLRTGDIRIPINGGFGTPGQVCLQQDNPLPMEILALIPEVLPGDTTQVSEPKQQGRGG